MPAVCLVITGYESHYHIYEKHINSINKQADKIIDACSKFIEENSGKIETQKDFALAIQQKSDKSFFFLLRKFGKDNLYECRLKMIEQLRKQLALGDFVE